MSEQHVSPISGEFSALLSAGWGITADRVLRGVGHALNGRAAALASWIDLADGGPVDVEYIEPEVQKLTELAKRVSALVVGSPEDSEPLMLAEVLGEAVPVHEMHRGLESVGTEVVTEGTPPTLRAPWARLTQVLILLLGDMAWEADQAKARRAIAALTDYGLRLEHSEVGERRMEPLEPRPLPSRAVILDALRPLVAEWGLRLVEEGGAVQLRAD